MTNSASYRPAGQTSVHARKHNQAFNIVSVLSKKKTTGYTTIKKTVVMAKIKIFLKIIRILKARLYLLLRPH